MKREAQNPNRLRRRFHPGRWQSAILALMLSSPTITAEPIEVSVNSKEPGIRISDSALGLSYETSTLLPDDQGRRYFRPWNKALVNQFRTLGVRSLRIGGNSVDDPKIPIPGEEDVRSLFEFANEAGVKVIYSFRLQDGDPENAARIAKFIDENFSSLVDCYAIGNEPGYYKDYAVYSEKWTAIRDAILKVVPTATFCGPDQNPEPELIKKMVRDFGTKEGRLTMITQHSYPFGCSYENPGDGMKDVALLRPMDAEEARAKMLQPEAYEGYQTILDGMVEAVKGTSLTFRMTEVNSFWFSGLEAASDRHASALWALDYLHWWASHGAVGLNFHTGDRTGGSVNLPCRYAAFVSAPNGYEVRPLGYGLKMFDLGGHGNLLPVELAADSGVAAYAVRRDDSIFVTLIHKRHETENAELKVNLDADRNAEKARIIWMLAEGHGLDAGSDGMSLGGEGIERNGTWEGDWKEVEFPDPEEPGTTSVSLSMPPASAAVLRLDLPQPPAPGEFPEDE